MDTHTQIKNLWNKYYSENFAPGQVKEKKIVNPDNSQEYFLLFFNPMRLEYLQRNKEKRKPSGLGFQKTLDNPDNIRFKNFIISKNLFPSQEYQLILPTIDIRTHLKKGDMCSIIYLSLETNYHFASSHIGSGAGVLSHVHFQGFYTPFPSANARKEELCNENGIKLRRTYFPGYHLEIIGKPEIVENIIFRCIKEDEEYHLIDNLNIPFNIIIYNGIVAFIPRPFEIPKRWKNTDITKVWKFGGAEVGGMLFPRSIEQYDMCNDFQMLANDAKEIMLSPLDANEFENFFKTTIFEEFE